MSATARANNKDAPLHWAAAVGALDVLALMLQSANGTGAPRVGASGKAKRPPVDCVTKADSTPLHIASGGTRRRRRRRRRRRCGVVVGLYCSFVDRTVFWG
jgi:hypothetical protein